MTYERCTNARMLIVDTAGCQNNDLASFQTPITGQRMRTTFSVTGISASTAVINPRMSFYIRRVSESVAAIGVCVRRRKNCDK
jgi:hypothetical protein